MAPPQPIRMVIWAIVLLVILIAALHFFGVRT
jgi:hypothetical protein